MKILTLPKTILLLITLALFSCEENAEIVTQTVPVSIQPIENQLIFSETNLKIIAEGFSDLVHSEEFRSDFYSELEKQKFDEYSVLVEELVAKSSISHRIKNSENFNTSINQYKNIDERLKYYPQVYIPFYSELKKLKNEQNKLLLTADTEPSIILLLKDGLPYEYPEYKFNKSGELEKTGRIINEEFAMENEVWVFSINEDAFLSKNGIDGYNQKQRDLKSQKVMSTETALIDKVKCKEHKESWAAGASEVNVIFFSSDYGFENTTPYLYGGGNFEGGEIYKFSRSQVNSNTLVDLNFFLLENWRDVKPNENYGSYVIFEYDTWPTATKEIKIYHGNSYLLIEYRSDDLYYDYYSEFRANYEYLFRNRTSMEINFRYYLNSK